MRAVSAALLMALAVTACELREITIAEPDDVIVAEIVLRPGENVQRALLHRTSSRVGSARVLGADIVVREDGTGRTFTLLAEEDSVCMSPPPAPGLASTATCYASPGSTGRVAAGQTYSLRIDLPDGRILTGTTTVPDTFHVVTPAVAACELAADVALELTWTRSTGASVYLVESRLSGLREALRARGAEVPGSGPLELIGLSIGAADTTLIFPSELGLFDRFNDELHPILILMRDGLPPNVRAEIAIAAADRNYVNWVRGGNFNPSGLVRISSVRGGGMGLFGAVTAANLEIRTPPSPLPGC